MVIGHDHFYAATVRLGDAIDTGNAVINGDDNVRRFFTLRQIDDFRCQTVTVFESVRHNEIDLCTKCAQTAQCDGAGRRAVAIVVGNDNQSLARSNRVGQECGCRINMQQAGRHDQRIQLAGQFAYVGQSARGKQARQHRVDALLAQHFRIAEGMGAGNDAGHGAKVTVQVWQAMV